MWVELFVHRSWGGEGGSSSSEFHATPRNGDEAGIVSTTGDLYTHAILKNPYEHPSRHWELAEDGQATQAILDRRRLGAYITPIPKPRKRKGKRKAKASEDQETLSLDEGAGVSTKDQEYDPTPVINELRVQVDCWRSLKNPADWGVTPATQRLLQHWRSYNFPWIRPFFCQVEAAETLIWLTEVAPQKGQREGKRFLDHLASANQDANPELSRLALKLATGAGKTTVMAMIAAGGLRPQ